MAQYGRMGREMKMVGAVGWMQSRCIADAGPIESVPTTRATPVMTKRIGLGSDTYRARVTRNLTGYSSPLKLIVRVTS